VATTVEVLAVAFKQAGTPFIIGHPAGESVELMEAEQRDMLPADEPESAASRSKRKETDLGGKRPIHPGEQNRQLISTPLRMYLATVRARSQLMGWKIRSTKRAPLGHELPSAASTMRISSSGSSTGRTFDCPAWI